MTNMTFTDIIEHKFAAVSDRKMLVFQSCDPVSPERLCARLAADPHIQRVDQADHDRQTGRRGGQGKRRAQDH